MRTDTIAAYTYNAEILCPSCAVQAVKTATGITMTPTTSENALDILAATLGINRYDEREYDSTDFPKVVFADQVQSCEHTGECADHDGPHDECCYSCGESLL